jgi:hypothetical protein
MRRLLRIALPASLVLALALAAAAPAGAADVTVNFSRDGGSRTVSLGSLAGQFDVNGEYALVSSSGQTTTRQIRGISLRALLDAVGADPTYSAVTIARPGGGAVRISRTQIEAGGAAPVVYEEAGSATFVRPSYSPSDRNAQDVVSGSPLVITQVDGVDYALKAEVSRATARTGQSLTFRASAKGAAGQKLVFSWNFDDGSTGSGESVRHKFSRRGHYRVLVSVRGEGETASNSKVVVVQVGKAVKSDKQREGGGTNDAQGAPVSGNADGTSGDGADAAAAAVTPKRTARRRHRRRPPASASSLTEVTGELLSAPAEPQRSSLAARSGQQAPKHGASAGGIPTEAAGAAAALGLLGLGIALEMGAAGRVRRRLLSN